MRHMVNKQNKTRYAILNNYGAIQCWTVVDRRPPVCWCELYAFLLIIYVLHQENVYFLDLNLSAFFDIFTYFTILFDNLQDLMTLFDDLYFLREVASTYK